MKIPYHEITVSTPGWARWADNDNTSQTADILAKW